MNLCKEINLRSRAGAIVFRDNNILLMYRQKNYKNYYTFPGGTIESNETITEAVVREVQEETSITITVNYVIYHLKINNIILDNNILGTKSEYLVLCDYISGTPALNSNAVEHKRKNNNNIYKPMWVPIYELKKLLLYPLEIRDLLFEDIKLGFNTNIRKIEVIQSNLRDK